MNKLIIFGGTFDPITNAHMRIAMEAYLRLNSDLIFVPSKSPRWKEPTETVENRLAMLKLAIKDKGSIGMSVCDYELKSKDEINYSIDTVKYLQKLYPETELYFLIGADQVNRFHEWRGADELSKMTHLYYIPRPGVELNLENVKKYKMTLLTKVGVGEVSSTKVRELESLDVPLSVLRYIESNRLYFINKLAKYLDEHRLNHSIAVANLARLIAIKNKLKWYDKCYIAGLLHDVGKSFTISKEKQLEFMKKFYPEYINLPAFSYHQFIGAYIAEHEFNIKDEEILDAIRYHCTGKANMSALGMIVYASDKIEPTRGFDSRFLINPCLRNYEKGFLKTLKDNKKYLLNHNKDITNELTDACFDMYLNKGRKNK